MQPDGMQVNRTAIQGGWVVAWRNQRHEVLDGGVVVVEGERVVFVGFPNDPGCPPADSVINASGKLVSPGLINFHAVSNIDPQLLAIDETARAVAYNRPGSVLDDDSPSHIFSDDDFRTSAEFSVASILKAGSTTFGNVVGAQAKKWEDPVEEPYAIAEAAERFGARAWVTHTYQETAEYRNPDGSHEVVWDRDKAQVGLDHAVGFVKHLQKSNSKLVTGFLFPKRTVRCSEDLLQETIRQSKALGNVLVRTHFAFYAEEYRDFKADNPQRTMVEWLRDIGFLGPQVCLVHCLFIAGHSGTGAPPGDDLGIIARSGTSVGHCPWVFARGGIAMESFSRYVAAGINVALGTDTFPPDIVQEMRVGALVNKVVDRQRGAGSVAEFYNAATIGGARAFGRDDLGKLAPGCAADITIFDLSDFATGPVDDPLRTLIHVATGKNCDTVMVAGKIVVENGSIPGLDEEALAHKAQKLYLRYKAGLAAWDHAGRSADEVFPPVLPMLRR